MEREIFRHKDNSGNWVVETTDRPGVADITTATFSGPDAEARSKEYYGFIAACTLTDGGLAELVGKLALVAKSRARGEAATKRVSIGWDEFHGGKFFASKVQ